MLKGTFPVEKFKQLSTPFYYYDVKLLQDTLDVVKTESGKYGYHVHYAVKANANPRILSIIAACTSPPLTQSAPRPFAAMMERIRGST